MNHLQVFITYLAIMILGYLTGYCFVMAIDQAITYFKSLRKENNTIHLSKKDFELLVDAIESPGQESSETLKKAVADYKAAIASGELIVIEDEEE